MELICTWYIPLVLMSTCCMSSLVIFSTNKVYTNKKPNNGGVWAVNTTSDMICAIRCAKDDNCKSFFYGEVNTEESNCIGYPAIIPEDISMTKAFGWALFAKDNYLGCFLDKLDPDRDLTLKLGFSQQRTPDECRHKCWDLGYMYAGLQWGKTCWCGDSFGKHGPRPESECNDVCTGDASLMCGGALCNSIYITDKRC